MLINKQTDIKAIKDKYNTIISTMKNKKPCPYNVYLRPIREDGSGGGLFELPEGITQFRTDPVTKIPENIYEKKGFRLLRTADEIETEFNKQIKALEEKLNKPEPVKPQQVKK